MMTKTRKHTSTKNAAKLFVILCCIFSTALFAQNKEERPNFIFIIADDMRWDAMGLVQKEQGKKARFPWLKTPNLDALASESVRFRNAMVATAVCSPSRAEYLTGRYGHFNGVANNQVFFPVDNLTYATELKKAGYTTGYIGKWHMKNQKERPGFDYFASYQGQGRYDDWFFLIDGVKTKTKGWIDDVSTNFAIDYINRDHKQPFVLAVGYKSPHIPFVPPARNKNLYAGEKVGPVPNFYNEAIFKPEYNNPPNPETRDVQPLWALDYFRCVTSIDENIGKLMAALDAKGLSENTVVIFTSDNGYYMGEHGLGDFMGDKRSAYEEALRVPLLVRYPKLKTAGKISDELVLNLDLAPTLLEFAEVAIPKEIQGESWVKLLKKPNKTHRKGFFYEYFFENKFSETPTVLAYRTKTHKLITYPDHPEWVELYDLENDPFEIENLALSTKYKSLLSKMQKAFKKEQKAVGYLLPDYAEKPWPEDYVPTIRQINYPWLSAERNKEVYEKRLSKYQKSNKQK